MTRFQVYKTFAGCVLACAVVTTVALTCWGQPSFSPAPRANVLLEKGRQAFSQRDFESAAKLYAQAKLNEHQLTPKQKQDLGILMQQNRIALKTQTLGQAQLKQAQDALDKGLEAKAATLLKSAQTNQYLSDPDKQMLSVLYQRLQSGSPTAKPLPEGNSPTPSMDYSELLKAARTALDDGDLEQAEQLALQAKQANKAILPNWVQPWRDSPTKILNQVNSARAAQQAANTPAPKKQRSGIAPFKAVKNLFNWNSNSSPNETPEAGNTVTKDDLNEGAQPDVPSPLPKGPEAAAPVTKDSNDNAQQLTDTQKARECIKKGYDALYQKDFAVARQFAEQAKALKPNLRFWEDTPEKLAADIERLAPAANSANPSPVNTVQSGSQPKAENPVDAKALLKQARAVFEAGRLDEAEVLCNQAAAVPNARWPLIGDSPNTLRSEILTARNQQNRKHSLELLAQARDLFKRGSLKEAKELTYKADKYYGEYSIWDVGDRPDKLRNQIIAAEKAHAQVDIPPPSGIGEKNSGVSPPPLPFGVPGSGGNSIKVVSGSGNQTEQALAKQKVLELINQSRQLQMQNRLIEARAKAVEAQKLAVAARKMGVVFGPSEENPDQVLLQLSVAGKQQIKQLLQQIQIVSGDLKDPQRFQKAAGVLQTARTLAVAFGLPQVEIDSKASWLGQAQAVAQGSTPPSPPVGPELGPSPVPPAGVGTTEYNQGKKFINDALRELSAGQTMLARKIAEEALNPKYGVQAQAAAVLRDITVEEMEQRKLDSMRNFLAMRDAMIQSNHARARFLSAAIDLESLPADQQRQFKEFMSMPEMMESTAVAGGPGTLNPSGSKPGKAVVTDQGPSHNSPGSMPEGNNPGFADNIKAMEKILLDKLAQEGAAVRQKALQAFKAGNHTQAIEMLRLYQEQVAQAKLSPRSISMLQSPIEKRIQQYKVIKAQVEFEKEMTAARKGPYHAEATRMQNKRQREQQIADLLEQARELFHKDQFHDAKMLAMKAKDLDPDNVAARLMYEMATRSHNKKEFYDIEDEKSRYRIETLNQRFGKPLDANSPIELNRTVMDKANERSKHAKGYPLNIKSEIERQIEHKLDSFINLNFKETPLKQAIQDLKYLSGINVVPDTAALAEASVNMESPITLDVEHIPLKSALNILLKKVNLTYVIKDDVLQITTEDHAKGNWYPVTYPVGDLVTPVLDSTKPPLPTLGEILNNYGQYQNYYGAQPPYLQAPQLLQGQPVSSYNNGTSGFAQTYPQTGYPQQFGGANGGWDLGRYSKRTIEDQLIGLIKSTIAPESWSDVGGKGTIQYFPLGMGMVVNQTQDIQEQVSDLLQALRRLQDLEVAIEIRLIAVSETFFERIGLDFDINITTDQGRFEPQVVAQQFQPMGFVNRFLPDGFLSGLTPAGTFTPDLNIPINNTSYDFTIPQIGFPGALGADGGLSIGLAFLSDIQVFMFLEAAQGDSRTNAMQAPRVTVFNGQLATLSVTDSIPFLTNIQPNSTVAPTFFIPTQQAVPVGSSINVQPVITADRRFVRIAITQTMNNFISSNVPLMPIQLVVQDQVIGGQPGVQPKLFQIFLQQPQVSTISVVTTVTVPDGGTVLLGGLKTMTEQRSEFGPPVLSKIPYINRLFRNVGYGRQATSLMMMVTPRIIINEEEELIYLEQLPPIPRP